MSGGRIVCTTVGGKSRKRSTELAPGCLLTNDILQYSKRESFSFGGVSSNRHVWEAEREVGKAAARDSEIRSQSAVGGCLIHRAQVNGVVMKPKPSDLAEKEPSLSGSLEPGARRGALFPP